jgi:hypothetical protein
MVRTEHDPHALMAALGRIEEAFGRRRGRSERAPDAGPGPDRLRPADEATGRPDPAASPRHRTLFVMGPLAEIAPDWRHPEGRLGSRLTGRPWERMRAPCPEDRKLTSEKSFDNTRSLGRLVAGGKGRGGSVWSGWGALVAVFVVVGFFVGIPLGGLISTSAWVWPSSPDFLARKIESAEKTQQRIRKGAGSLFFVPTRYWAYVDAGAGHRRSLNRRSRDGGGQLCGVAQDRGDNRRTGEPQTPLLALHNDLAHL